MNDPLEKPASALRVAYLAAGAAGMYCGSCIRDNRLAATLIAQGRDVLLIPLYTPIRTDEIDVSSHTVYYGGINVYLEQRFRFFRNAPALLRKIFDAPGVLKRAMRLSGSVRAEDLGPMTISVLKGEHGAQRVELLRLMEALGNLRPQVVHLPNLPFVGIAKTMKEELGVRVLCTLSGEDIFLDQLAEPYRKQALELIKASADHVDAYVAVTDYYADFAAGHFSLPREKVHVVRMGIEVDDFTLPGERVCEKGLSHQRTDFAFAAAAPERPFTIGYLARICREKGLAELAEAFILLRKQGRDCRVVAAGYFGKSDRPYLEQVQRRLRQAGVTDHFQYLGEVTREQKIEMLRSLDVFSVPTVYHEAKGLYILEALAAGIPVVQPAYGSFPELLDVTGGGLLYDGAASDRAEKLAAGLAQLMDDPQLRLKLGAQGRQAVRERFTDEVMADQMWALYEQICGSETI